MSASSSSFSRNLSTSQGEGNDRQTVKGKEFAGWRENTAREHDHLDSEVLNVEGLNLAKKGELLDAVLCFQKSVSLNPNNAKAWYNYGTSLTKIGKFDDSTLRCFEKALEIDLNNAEAWNNRGSVLYAIGRDKEALESYQRAIELAPSNARVWTNMGALFEKLGNKRSAKECYRNAVQASA